MIDDERALFLSLRPAYADAIMEGRKRVELRRSRPQSAAGKLAVIYAASPRRAALGVCRVDAIAEATPVEIWRQYGSQTGIAEDTYMAYFKGTDRAVAITLGQPRLFAEPVPLHRLRRQWLGFQPPQVFRYVPVRDIEPYFMAPASHPA